MNDTEARAIAAGSFGNRDRVLAAPVCGCFYCLAVFPGREARSWVDAGRTALCPRCGIDAVLPGVTDDANLRSLHHHRFEVSYKLDAPETPMRAAGE